MYIRAYRVQKSMYIQRCMLKHFLNFSAIVLFSTPYSVLVIFSPKSAAPSLIPGVQGEGRYHGCAYP